MLASLQIFLVLLYLLTVSEYSSEASKNATSRDEQSSDLDVIGREDDVHMIPVTAQKICWGQPKLCVDIETKVTFSRKDVHEPKKTKTSEKYKTVACYRNITIKMTKTCSQFQLIDFSNLTVHDFCINQYIRFGGSVSIFRQIYKPFKITFNTTKMVKSCEKNRPGKKYRPFVVVTDGCKLFGTILCTQRREWCGCPIPWGKAPLFYAKMFAAADVIPKRLGAGKFIAKATFDFPRGSACMEMSYERKYEKILI